MEPRPQQPRQPSGQRNQSPGQTPPGGSAPPSTSHYQPIPGHGPIEGYPEGYDPTTVVAPPRTDYDYSPLDLAPPGQRRRRQLIAGAIGALSIILIGALIVFGWVLLRDDNPDGDVEDRVAITGQTPESNEAGATGDDAAGTPPVTVEATTDAAAPTEPSATEAPTAPPAGAANVATDEAGLTAILPEPPAGFEAGGDTVLAQADVVTALGGSRIAEQNLTNWGWTANIQREYTNPAPEAGATSSLTVSLHGFKDAPSAAESLPFYSDVLLANGYYEVEAPAIGETARMLQLDQEDGGVLVALYVQEGPVLYRFGGYAMAGNPTQDVINIANQTLGTE
jgi:hypothetical protein